VGGFVVLPHQRGRRKGVPPVGISTGGLRASITVSDVSAAASLIVIGAVAFLVLAVLAVRIVPHHERAVVYRFGRVIRVKGPGLAVRVPGLERVTLVSFSPVRLQLVASATTRDGVCVRMLANGLCRITDPARSVSFGEDAFSATGSALENKIAKEMSHLDVAALLDAGKELEERVPREITAFTQVWGTEVLDLEVCDIEARLTADLLHARRRPGSVDQQ
jgi:regulator of protease activity HflC (stomatin/prohibitin superfamily)